MLACSLPATCVAATPNLPHAWLPTLPCTCMMPPHAPLGSPSPQVRIEQVLRSSPPPLLCFRLAQLLAFYLSTVESLLGAGSQLAGEPACCGCSRLVLPRCACLGPVRFLTGLG